MDDLFERLLQETPGDTKRFVARSMDVSDQITALLKKKEKSQKWLADKLGKHESEISKWLSGNHNFTLRSLAKIEDVLKEDVLVAPMYWDEYQGSFKNKATVPLAAGHAVAEANVMDRSTVSSTKRKPVPHYGSQVACHYRIRVNDAGEYTTQREAS